MRRIQKLTLRCEDCGDSFEHFSSKPGIKKHYCEFCSYKRNYQAIKNSRKKKDR